MTNPLPRIRPELFPSDLLGAIQQRSTTEAVTANKAAQWMRAEPRDLSTALLGQALLSDCPMTTLVTELVDQVDRADPSQAGHAARVAALATMLGSSIGMNVTELRALRVSALLHDVGKILVPSEILGKNGPLTSSETAEVRRHVVYGGAILRRIPVLAFAASTARWHHERWDGLGYPDRIVGPAIPLYARIVAVADALDAMTSDRAYCQAISLHAAFEELESESGAQFDPLIVAAVGPLVGAVGFQDSWVSLASHMESLPIAA
ncbi:MAG: HD-GYP domain-containing protein [Planctomycetota bacterium]|nr:HD-GYP domain-containing protein [Planctomycetota bacterium]